MEKNTNGGQSINQTHGITLIALIVTIIILLILAGAAINMAVGADGIFRKASDAVDKHNNAVAEEGQLLKNLFNAAYIGIEIGDYVDYSPISNNYTTDVSKTGYDSVQMFDTEETNWRVLDIIGNTMLLISEKPLNTDSECYGFGLRGGIGWNNAKEVLHEVCQVLYSKNEVGTARSMTFEDVAKLTGWNYIPHDAIWLDYLATYSITGYTEEYEYTDKYHPEIDNGETASNFILKSNFDLFWWDDLHYFGREPVSFVINEILGDYKNGDWFTYEYWLANNAIDASRLIFGVGAVCWGGAGTSYYYLSYGNGGGGQQVWLPLRPVVTLRSGIQIEVRDGTIDVPHHIL